MANCETLLVDRPRAGIAVATLNRPDRLNALTFGMFDELAQLAADVGADDRMRVLVLTGAGRGFCAGLDLGGRRDAAGHAGGEVPRGAGALVPGDHRVPAAA